VRLDPNPIENAIDGAAVKTVTTAFAPAAVTYRMKEWRLTSPT
jgi:hypothetical protein